MNAYTPGPWEVKETSGPSYGSTCYWVPGVCHHIDIEANAHLISAAPDLLELAYQYISDLRHPMSEDSRQRRIERAEAVIAKTEGR